VAYLLVLVLAAAAGAAVGVATFRMGRTPSPRAATWTQTYEAPAAPSGAAEVQSPTHAVSSGRRQPLPTDPTTRSRIAGVLGLLIACFVAAGAIVAALYAVYLAVRSLFGG